MKAIFTFVFIISISALGYGQIYLLNNATNNTTINTCSGTFYDSGGINGNYSNNETYTVTFCPNQPNTAIELAFSFNSLLLANGDQLCFYDGNSTAAPLLGCSTSNMPFFVVQATATNSTGCITVEFTSDAALNAAGWVANISCIFPCQTVLSDLTSSSPAVSPSTGTIDVCQGETVTLIGQGTYPQNNTTYVQSDATSTFEWTIEGQVFTGPVVNYTFNNPGGFRAQLKVTDINGCESTNLLDQEIRVSGDAHFVGTTIPSGPLCAGDTLSFIDGNVTQSTEDFAVQLTVGDSIFLPDGNGVTYSTSVLVNDFLPGQLITNISDIASICVNMEHSYMGDLNITITCPTGQTVTLHQYSAGGGTYLGIPVDVDATPLIPGDGFDYCWEDPSPNPTWATASAGVTTLPAGSYSPSQSFSGLIGCELNGNWTITIQDNLTSDNGFIFNWGVNFNPSIYPLLAPFTPGTDTTFWVNNSTITSFFGDTAIMAVPNEVGTTNYIFSTINEFGCQFDTMVSVDILPITSSQCLDCDSLYSIVPMTDTVICETESASLDATPNSNLTTSKFTYISGQPVVTGNTVEAALNVSDISPNLVSATSIVSVCVDLEHQVPADFDIFLIAPSGQVLELSTDNGGFSAITNTYPNTCFTPTAINPINSANAPFTGTYAPEGNFNLLNGSVINGTWKLQVTDDGTFGVDGIINSWSITFNNTSNFTYNWTPATGLSCTNCPNPTASPTTSTDYIVNITDNFGCTKADTVNVSVIQQLPTPIVSCGTITGTSIEITWAAVPNAVGYEVNVNNNGWIPANGNLSHIATGFSTNQTVTFQVRANLGNSCDGNNGIGTVQCTTLPCAQIVSLDSTQAVSCFGGNDGIAYISTNGDPLTTTYTLIGGTTQNIGTFSNLSAGTYQVFATDVFSCIDTIGFTVTEPDTMTFVETITETNCFGESNGSISVSVTGGTAPYTYAWSTGTSTTNTVSSLSAGNYTVTVTDANNCTKTTTYTVTQPTDITLQTSTTDVLCFGGNTGTATVTASGSVGDYNYTWNTIPAQLSDTAFNLSIGNYQVIVSDSNGCLDSATVTINQPTALSITMNPTDNVCFGESNGSMSANVIGGTTPYTYAWSTGTSTNNTINNLPIGNYTVTVTDANNCQTTAAATITQPTDITLQTSTTDVLCFGGNTGTATVTAAGGVGNYGYTWNTTPNQTTNNATNLSIGNYQVIVNDGNGCLDSATVTISEPTALTVTMTTIDNICFGESNGSMSANVAGGVAPYTYAWSTGTSTTNSISNLPVGSYTVTVTDANNCQTTATANITQPTDITLLTSTTDALCFGGNSGTASVIATGGVGNYSYVWSGSPVQTTDVATNLSLGTYEVTVSDNNGCLDSATVTINQPTPLTTTTDSTDASCFGFNDGTASVIIGGGTMPYSYNWSTTPAQDSSTAIDLTAGTYFVTATDANGCTIFDTTTINQPTEIQMSFTTTQVTCFGLSDGAATVYPTGGVGSIYTYAWNTTPTQNLPTATNLPGGFFEVTITDSTNCSVADTVYVFAPVILDLDTLYAEPTLCYGSNEGLVGVQTSGGSGVKTYVWNTNPLSNGAVQSNLFAGTYSVTATDQQGCQLVDSITVQQPDSIQATFITDSLTCFQSNDGTATVSIIGGTANYTYLWSNGQTSTQTTGLSSSFVAVTITDANNCVQVDSVFVPEPLLVTSVMSSTQVSCNGDGDGTATVVPSGGTMPYTYLWSDNQTTSTAINLDGGMIYVTVSDSYNCSKIDSISVLENPALVTTDTSFQVSCTGAGDGTGIILPQGGTGTYSYQWQGLTATTDTVPNLVGGTYFYTVTDSDNCTFSDSVNIFEPTPLVSTSSGTPVSCFGDIDGTATVTPLGGTTPYFYSWSNSVANASTVFSLSPGYTYVTVTDLYNCQTLDSVLIEEPTLVAATTVHTATLCFGSADGTATVTPAGGVGNYTYNWLNDNQTTATAVNLLAGDYIVMVADSNGCTAFDTVTVTQPTALNTTATITNTSCFGYNDGAISLTTTGGVGAYAYQWSTSPNDTLSTINNLTAGTYPFTITDDNSCILIDSFTVNQPDDITYSMGSTPASCYTFSDGSAFITVAGGTAPYNYNWSASTLNVDSITGLPFGNYSVTITDSQGCTAADTVLVDEPTPLSLSLSQQPTSCFGVADGEAYVVISGGTPNYSMLWNDAFASSSDSVGYLVGNQTYTVTVTDNNGCVAVDSIFVIEPDPITAQVVITDETCYTSNNGIATAIINGGTAPFSYNWGTNANNQTTQTATNLAAGVYTVLISDNNNCNTQATGVVNQPDSLEARLTQQDVLCYGDATGTATAAGIGGVGSYTYSWQTNNGVQIGDSATGLSNGVQIVTITDGNGCEVIDTVNINQPDAPLTATIMTENIDCFGDENGRIEVTSIGGVTPYTYILNENMVTTSNVFVGLDAGNYNITIEDHNGCTLLQQATITQPDEIIVDLGADILLNDGDNAVLEPEILNGFAPFIYVWQPADSTLSCGDCLNPIVSGITFDKRFDFVVTDANGCTGEDFIMIRTRKVKEIFVANAFTPNNDGNNDVLYVQGNPYVAKVKIFRIFDRWGELIYERTDVNPNDETVGWDGTYKGQAMNSNSFVWFAEIEYADGDVRVYQGSTILIR